MGAVTKRKLPASRCGSTMSCSFLLYLSLLLLRLQELYAQSPCTPPSGRPGCVCRTKEGVIDLSTIANTDGTPKYKDLIGPNEYKYAFNPCYGFGIGNSGCTKNTVACQDEKYGSIQYSCGDASTEAFIYNDIGDNRLEYVDGEEGRTTIVTLHCDLSATTPRVTTLGDSVKYYAYHFDLYSECACPGQCGRNPNEPTTNGGGGGGGGVAAGEIGLVLIFLIIACLISYFVIGAMILKFKFEKTGLDLIPQRKFWLNLLLLIKDGCIFTWTTITRLLMRRSKDGYVTLK